MRRKLEIEKEIKDAKEGLEKIDLLGFQSKKNKYMVLSGYICALEWVLEKVPDEMWAKLTRRR